MPKQKNDDSIFDNLGDELEQFLDSEQDEPNTPLYHYTSYKGLEGILKSRSLRITTHKDMPLCDAVLAFLAFFVNNLNFFFI